MNVAPAVVAAPKHRSGDLKTEYLSVILKVAERCNLACPYCYFFFSGDDSYMLHPAFVDEGTVDKVIEFVRNAKEESGVKAVRVGFHGGEPLLLKKHRFRDMCKKFRSALGEEPDLTLVVQTNGVLIDAEWIDVFSDCGVRVGVSMDGDEHIHNKTRVTKRGKGTYAETRRGWEMLISASEAGKINFPGLLCVVSAEHSGGVIFDHFVDELGARGMSFLLPDVTYQTPEATPEFVERCGDFLVEVCARWFDSKKKDVSVRFVDEVVGPMINDELLRRSEMRHDAFAQVCISSNGEICPDDVIRSYGPQFAETGEHIERSRYRDIVANAAWSELRRAQSALPDACLECTWRRMCGGGLLQHRYSSENGFANPSIYCASLKRLYGYVASRLASAGYSMSDIERRLTATSLPSPIGEPDFKR